MTVSESSEWAGNTHLHHKLRIDVSSVFNLCTLYALTYSVTCMYGSCLNHKINLLVLKVCIFIVFFAITWKGWVNEGTFSELLPDISVMPHCLHQNIRYVLFQCNILYAIFQSICEVQSVQDAWNKISNMKIPITDLAVTAKWSNQNHSLCSEVEVKHSFVDFQKSVWIL